MKYFSLPELCVTGYNVDNIPNWEHVENLRRLSEHLLDPVRVLAKQSVHVNSGYRCPAVNKLAKGAENSGHMRGECADITVGDIASNKVLFDKILKSGLLYDQLILERGGIWIHVSLVVAENRKQILYLD